MKRYWPEVIWCHHRPKIEQAEPSTSPSSLACCTFASMNGLELSPQRGALAVSPVRASRTFTDNKAPEGLLSPGNGRTTAAIRKS